MPSLRSFESHSRQEKSLAANFSSDESHTVQESEEFAPSSTSAKGAESRKRGDAEVDDIQG